MKPLEIVGIIVGVVGLGVGLYALTRQQGPKVLEVAGAKAGVVPSQGKDEVPGVAIKPSAPPQDQLGNLVKAAGDAAQGVGELINQGRGLVDAFTGLFA